MKARPKLTDSQKDRVIAMASDGSTYAEIAALLHVPVASIGVVVTEWVKSNLSELQNNLRELIDSSIDSGKQFITLPKVSHLVLRPVLGEYAARYFITKRNRLGCTWYQFTTHAPHAPVSNPRRYSASAASQATNYSLRRAAEAVARADGLCVKCLKRPHVKRGYKCAECIAYIRASNASKRLT